VASQADGKLGVVTRLGHSLSLGARRNRLCAKCHAPTVSLPTVRAGGLMLQISLSLGRVPMKFDQTVRTAPASMREGGANGR